MVLYLRRSLSNKKKWEQTETVRVRTNLNAVLPLNLLLFARQFERSINADPVHIQWLDTDWGTRWARWWGCGVAPAQKSSECLAALDICWSTAVALNRMWLILHILWKKYQALILTVLMISQVLQNLAVSCMCLPSFSATDIGTADTTARCGWVWTWWQWLCHQQYHMSWAMLCLRRLSPAEAWVCSWVSPRGICSGQSDNGKSFSPSSSVFPCQYHSPYISFGVRTISLSVAAGQRHSLTSSP
jgi:hypothetical protein